MVEACRQSRSALNVTKDLSLLLLTSLQAECEPQVAQLMDLVCNETDVAEIDLEVSSRHVASYVKGQLVKPSRIVCRWETFSCMSGDVWMPQLAPRHNQQLLRQQIQLV